MIPYAQWLCWAVPALGAVIVPLLDLTEGARKYKGHLGASTIGLSVTFAASMIEEAVRGEVIDYRLQVPPPMEIGVLIDPLSVLMAVLVSVIGLFVALFSHGYIGEDPGLTRFWFVMQLFISGYLIIVLADNLLFMFIGWEIVGICCTYLTAYQYRIRRMANLGFQVNTVLRIGDIALFIFILMVYTYAGTFNFVELSESHGWITDLSRSGLLLISSLLFLGGVIGKAAQFPLHEWLPDMLVGTPSSSNALTECLAGPYLMARALPIFYEAYASGLSELLHFFLATAWIGAITAFLAALTATAQRHPQRVMAYAISSIIGFMLTALGLGGLNGTMAPGYLAGTTILTVDAFISALLILSTVYVSYAVGSEDLLKMGGFRYRLVHQGMEVAVFAMINVPPFSGFWLSNWVQSLALELSWGASGAGESLLVYSGYGLFALLILAGGISAFYALRVMGLAFGGGYVRRRIREAPRSMRLSFFGLLIITTVIDLTVPLIILLFDGYFVPITGVKVFSDVFAFVVYIIPSVSTLLTLLALAVGGYVSYRLYIARDVDLAELMHRHPFINRIRLFLEKRCWVDAAYRWVAHGTIAIARGLYRNVEMEGIKTFKIRGINEFFDIAIRWLASLSDWIYPSVELGIFERINEKIVEVVVKASERVRSLQTGILSYNILLMAVGAVAVGVILLIFGGF
jgi:NADH-quinone oxidoreductase subunit L